MDGACVSVSGGIKRQHHARKERLGWAPCAPADELVSVWVSRFAGIVCLAIYFFPVSRLVRFAGKATWTLWKPWERPSGGALVAIEELVQDVFQGLLDIVPTFVDATLAFTGVIANLPIIQVFDEKPISEVLMPVLVVTMMGTLYFAFACCCLPHSGYETFGARSVIFHVAFFFGSRLISPGHRHRSWWNSRYLVGRSWRRGKCLVIGFGTQEKIRHGAILRQRAKIQARPRTLLPAPEAQHSTHGPLLSLAE